jgi:hypothetical protein
MQHDPLVVRARALAALGAGNIRVTASSMSYTPANLDISGLAAAEMAERNRAALEALRARRDELLTACDWTQMPDSPLEVAKRTAWAAYRQQLRDLPANTSDPSNPVWPAVPV